MADKNKNLNYNVNINTKVDSSVKNAQNLIKKLKDNLNSLKEKINLPKIQLPKLDGVKKSFSDLKGKVTEFANEIPGVGTAINLLKNPIGAAITATIAWGAAMIATAKEIKHVDEQVSALVTDSKDINTVTDQVRALNKTFDVSSEEILKSANAMSKQFNISLPDALKKVEQGLIATNGKLELADINEFGSVLKAAGGSADDLVKNLAFSKQEGLFGNKSVDALKDWTKNIKGGGDNVRDLLQSIGKKDVFTSVQKGTKTALEAYNDVFADIDSLSSKKQQELLALLGGSADVLQAKGAKLLATNNKSIEEMMDKYKDANKLNEANKELTEAQGKATRSLINPLKKIELIWIKIQTFFYDISSTITDLGVEISKIFSDIFGGLSDLNIMSNIMNTIKTIWSTIGSIIKGVIIAIRGVIKVFKVLFTFISDKFKKLIEGVFGEGIINKWKEGFLNMINFITSKFMQLIDTVKYGFEALEALIEGDREKATKLYSDSKESAGKLFSNDTRRVGTGFGATGSWGEEENKKTTESVDNINNKIMDNAVASSVQGEVKNITINMDAIQKVATQNINGIEDLPNFKYQLQSALVSIIEDTSNN